MNYYQIILFIVASFILMACANSAATNYRYGREAYENHCYQESFEYMKKAAQQKNVDAMYTVGYMYYYGIGTELDVDAGIVWIRKSAEKGNPRAIRALREIENSEPRHVRVNDQQEFEFDQDATIPGYHAPVFYSYAKRAYRPLTNANAARLPRPVPPSSSVSAKAAPSNAIQPVAPQATPKAQPQSLSAPVQGLLSAPASDYVIELMSDPNEQQVVNFIDTHQLQGKAIYYPTVRNGKPWYVLVYGRYRTHAEAYRALVQLPPELEKYEPWIRGVDLVQTDIRQGQGGGQ